MHPMHISWHSTEEDKTPWTIWKQSIEIPYSSKPCKHSFESRSLINPILTIEYLHRLCLRIDCCAAPLQRIWQKSTHSQRTNTQGDIVHERTATGFRLKELWLLISDREPAANKWHSHCWWLNEAWCEGTDTIGTTSATRSRNEPRNMRPIAWGQQYDPRGSFMLARVSSHGGRNLT